MRRRRGIDRAYIATTTAFAWLCVAIAATAFWPVYESFQFVLVVAVTTVVATVIAVTAAVYRLPAHVVGLAVVGAYAVLGVPLAVPSRALYGVFPTLQGLRDLAVGTATSWKQLVTVTLPVGSFEALLVPVFLLTLLVVTITMSVALRSTKPAWAALGPVVLFLTGIAFGSAVAFLPFVLALALTAATLLWLTWSRARRSIVGRSAASGENSAASVRPVPMRTLLAAVAIIAVAAGGSVAAATAVPPTAEREVVRTAVEQPFDPRDYPSPLSAFRRYLEPGAASTEMASVDGLEQGDRLRIATLDSYDGITYSVGSDRVASASGTFSLVPFEFDQSAVEGDPVDIEVTIGAYEGVWVPTVGQLESVRFTGAGAGALRDSFYYNDNSGTAASLAELDDGDRYALSGVVPKGSESADVSDLTPGTATLPRATALPDELSVALDRYVDGVESAGDRLEAALDGLRAEGYVSHGVGDDEPFSRSGHSADRLTELFTATPMVGDEEQYAVAAALMARELGFPARVVMGFVPEVTSATTVVRGDDVSAWIEVDTAENGWVTLDPTPLEREIPDEVVEEPTQVARPQSPVQPPVDDQDQLDDQVPPDTLDDDTEEDDGVLAWLAFAGTVLAWLLVAAAIIAAPFLAIVGAKVRRRILRRRSAEPVEAVTAGWREFEDAVVDHGFDPPASATRSELAAVVPGGQAGAVAAAADRAVFSPTGASRIDADQVWRAVDELRADLDRGLTRRERFAAAVSLRSFDSRRGARTTDEPRRSR
ncbi:transglutaminaseTgpA domain-containing protein [Marisediminicola sp. LYQ85]|uniref:transglutaminaseTgpA domain-containing protein n=1 Tax=Marisediminicola sp. LYQ85 TaxID=3391062 RepID=UPI0039835A1F